METLSVPFRQFVLKVHSRCDLACDHCYVYEHEDTSWRGRPKVASDEVLARTAERIAEHARSHGLAMVHVVLHGGEPLLAGPALLRRAGELLYQALDGVCALDLRIHTNGVQLSERYLELFLEQGVKVGISLDGDRAANDLHRRYADGRSSYAQVLKAVELLNRPRYRPLFAGLLCTIDVRNDPAAVYDALLALDPPRIDFLLPHATWDTPPLRPDGEKSTPYADWLGVIYERWEAEGRPVPVRMFDSVLSTLRGGPSMTESLGLDPADLVVIETDGTLEQADSLKTAFDGAPATGFDVFAHDLDTAARHPGMIDRQLGLEGLAEACRSCPVVRSCGGGLYAHRYRTGTDFDNPSVFCGDLLTFITQVRDRPVMTAEPVPNQQAPEQQLTERQLDQLAAGYGGADTVRALVEAQLEVSRDLLAEVWGSVRPDRRSKDAWALITDLDRSAPDALDAVLAHPYTRAWAMRCLRPAAGTPAGDAGGGLAEIAASAVLRAGVGEGVHVPLRQGVLRLPGLGAVLLGNGSGAGAGAGGEAGADGAALVRADGRGGFTVAYAGDETSRYVLGQASADPRWQPLHRIAAGPHWSLRLEDTDPERTVHQYPVAGRLSGAEHRAWTSLLGEARQLIDRALPRYAPGLAAGLSVVTPLARPGSGEGRDLSAASRDAFGAVGIARPERGDILALLLVHEFQHVKLGAVLDLFDLFDRDDTRLFRAPWRPDPRPLEGLLQGTYAHVGVTEFWASRVRDHREHGQAVAELVHAERQLERWRSYTAEAVETLAGSGALTPLGERFAAGMRDSVAPLLHEPVDPRIADEVRRSIAADEAAWAARHGAAVGG
jgi:uncharacterized protein